MRELRRIASLACIPLAQLGRLAKKMCQAHHKWSCLIVGDENIAPEDLEGIKTE